MTKPIMNWFSLLLALTSTSCGIAFAANSPTLSFAKRSQSNFAAASHHRRIPYGGAAAAAGVAATTRSGSSTSDSSSTTLYAASTMDGSTEIAGNQKVCFGSVILCFGISIYVTSLTNFLLL